MRRFAGYLWACPITLIGLALAVLCRLTGGEARLRDGVVEASGGIIDQFLRGGRAWSGGAAMTLGHVILARDRECLERSNRHERMHVRQFERWGVFLFPAYLGASTWLALRGYDGYLENPFEIAANDTSDKLG